MTHAALAEWSAWVWPRLADHLWQATLFAVLAGLAAWLLRRGGAGARHAVWLIASAKFAIPAAALIFAAGKLRAIFPESISSLGAVPGFSPLVFRMVEPAGATLWGHTAHSELLCALSVLWVAGVIACLCRWRSQKPRWTGLSRPGPAEMAALDRAKALLGFRGQVQMVISESCAEPVVCGVRRPRLILPAGLSAELTDVEFQAVLLHELLPSY